MGGAVRLQGLGRREKGESVRARERAREGEGGRGRAREAREGRQRESGVVRADAMCGSQMKREIEGDRVGACAK